MWAALEVAQASDFVAGDAGRPARADRAGRHQRVGRSAPAAVDRPRADPQARHLRVRRLVLGARPRDRRAPARRARPVHAGRGGRDRGAARLDDLDRRRHPRARGRRRHRPRHARRADPRLPDVRGDRPVADRREERRHDAHRRSRSTSRQEELDLSRARDARRRPLELGGRARRAVEGLQATRSAAWAGCSGRCGSCSCIVVVVAVASATLNVFGPRVLGHGTDIIVTRRHSGHDIDFGALHHVLSRRVAALRGVVAAVDRRGVHARRRHPAADVQAALRRRGQGQRAAAQLHRQAVSAATCSAGSPTTSTTSRRACSRR